MELVINKIFEFMEKKDGNWSEIEKMKMRLGFQILFHNFFMVSIIIMVAQFCGIVEESVILLIGYGALKLKAGGEHLKKSLSCLLATSIFIIIVVKISTCLNFTIWEMSLLYIICAFILWIIGPQGTDNNPILNKNYNKLRVRTVIILGIYLLITLYVYSTKKYLSNLLLVATIFETASILPNVYRNANKRTGR